MKNFSLYPNGLDFTYNFVEGVNLIIGGNGTGKTTFISIIKFALIGLYKRESRHKRTYLGRDITGRLQLPQNYFRNRTDIKYKSNENAEVELTYRHKENGEVFKERKDWEAKGYKEEDMAQDVLVKMPPLDLLSKTK